MGDYEFLEDEIDWNRLLTDPLTLGFFSNPSPDGSVSSRIGEIESILMNDVDDSLEPNQQSLDNFFADIFVDPSYLPASGGELIELPIEKDENGSDEFGNFSPPKEKAVDEPEVNNSDYNNNDINNDGDADDPISKKRRRQLRNRDAAVRSRERKKMYVKDLEIKSRYMEGECRKLGRLLQCVLAENQALRFSLQNGNAYGASSAKQESAVLLLGMIPLLSLCLSIIFTAFEMGSYLFNASLKEIGKEEARIPAVGFPALVPGHHVPIHSAQTDPVRSGVSSTGSSCRKGSRKSGSKRSRK